MKCCCKKLFPILFVLIALGIGVTVTIWPEVHIHKVVAVTRFFEIMLPVLAVGALLKYLMCCQPTESASKMACPLTKKSCCKKLFVLLFVLIALGLGVIVTLWPVHYMHKILAITRFFEVMLPVLAVGALFKYLLCCGPSK